MLRLRFAVLLTATCLPVPALAELPDPVRAMIEAAVESGDRGKVATVVAIAKQTNPDDVSEIEQINRAFLAEQKEADRLAKAEAQAALRNAAPYENWSGKGELGAFRATGNNSNTGLTTSLNLEREGLNWTHDLRLRADYQRSNGTTTRERYLAAYEPRFQISDRLFAYGLLQYDSDRFQGFDHRYAASAGVGYRIIDDADLSLNAKLGPAYRITKYTTGASESRIAGLVGLDFDWQLSDRIAFTQDTNLVSETNGGASVIVESDNTSVAIVNAMQLRVSDSLSTRLSYQIDYESNPPANKATTDTLSRFTLVYDFK